MDALYDRQINELDVCNRNIDLFVNYISDYTSLAQKLSTLSDKSRYEVMVPLAGSKIAFMPGYVHHTNEVLVLIGENYFVEKSTKEASQFVERRIKFCQEKLDELKAQQRMLLSWAKATQDVKGDSEELIDITEHWTEEDLQKWQEKHAEAERKSRKEEKTDSINFEEFFEKYEKQEAQQDETSSNHKNEEFFTLNIKETDQESVQSTISSRPISKFKASRSQKN